MDNAEEAYERFETEIEQLYRDKLRADEAFAIRLYSSLTNVIWRHSDGAEVSYSFRSAGHLISQIRRKGTYLDWYCSGPEGRPDDEIITALGACGWQPKVRG